jgi:hypothetical protein
MLALRTDLPFICLFALVADHPYGPVTCSSGGMGAYLPLARILPEALLSEALHAALTFGWW